MATAPDPFERALEELYPPDPTGERASPAEFAARRSRGRWKRARHLEVIEQACLDTIATGGRLMLSVSVRHGKSEYASRWLVAWFLGRHPDKRVILAGHEADFAAQHGRAARDILTEYGPEVFGVSVSKRSEASNRWDIDGRAGGMITVGVGGSPIGRGGDLVVVDDPLKSYEAAMSPLVRKRLHDWWTGTMVSRIEPGGAVIIICARWHENDLTGFLKSSEDGDQWHELRMPAICDDPDNDPTGRALGEALWPERYPVPELARRKRETSLSLGEAVWQAQFQGTPRKPKGGKFPEERWGFVSALHYDWDPTWVRAWDLAATEGGGDWTVGVLIGTLADGRTVIRDVRRGQWSADDVRAQIKKAAAEDPAGTRIELPQDPGQAGKDQGQQLVRLLAGHNVNVEPVTGDKEVRATGLSAQQRAYNVLLWEAEWNGPFVAELQAFPTGTHDDQVDAASTGFNTLHRGGGVVEDTTYADERLTGR